MKYKKGIVLSPSFSLASQVLLDNGLIEPTKVNSRTPEGVVITRAGFAITERGKKALREYLLEVLPKESEINQTKVKEIRRIGFDAGHE